MTLPTETASSHSTTEIGPAPLCDSWIQLGQQYEPPLPSGTPLAEIANVQHMEHAAAEITRHPHLGDWYRRQLNQPAAWVESPILACELHAMRPDVIAEAARRAVFLGLYVAGDSDSESYLQNSDHNEVIKQIALSLPYYSTAEDGIQVIALLRRILWPSVQSHVQPSRNRTPLQNLNLLVESFGVLVRNHPEQLDPQTFYLKLKSSRVFHGQDIIAIAKEIRHSLEGTEILIPKMESQLAWNLSINRTTAFMHWRRTQSILNIEQRQEMTILFSVFSIYFNRQLPPPVRSHLAENSRLVQWSREKLSIPQRWGMPKLREMLPLHLLALWAYEMWALGPEDMRPSREEYVKQDILEYFGDVLQGKGNKGLYIEILARMIQALHGVLSSQYSPLAPLMEPALHISRQLLLPAPAFKATRYWITRLTGPIALGHNDAASICCPREELG
ncbi:hypothetical protein V2G26_017317 [Clonostachys chloroleuca]